MSVFVEPVAWPGHMRGPLEDVFGGATVLSEVVATLWLLFAADRAPSRAKRARCS